MNGPMRVVVDPGHGGKDPGRVGRIGEHLFRESEVNWTVGVALATLLTEQGFEVRMTRHQKGFLTPRQRVEFANAWGHFDSTAFVSVHCNGHGNISAHGFEVWHYPGSLHGENLARSVLTSLESRVDRRSRGLKPKSNWDRQQVQSLTVLSETLMPAILVEMEFLSNRDGQIFLAQGASQVTLATAMAEGVIRWFERRKRKR